MKKTFFIITISLVMSVIACQNNSNNKTTTTTTSTNADTPSSFKNCKYGAPTAIFTAPSPEITYHTFVLSKDIGIENVNFKDGTLLDIEQSGCDFMQQQYTFTFKGDFSKLSDAQWKAKGVEWFKKIGTFSQQYTPFSQWGKAIEDAPKELPLGEQYQLEKGSDYSAFVKIDKIVSSTEAKLIITELIK